MNQLYLRLRRLIAAPCPPGFDKAVPKADLQEGRSLLRIVAGRGQVPLSEEPVQHMLETLRAIQ